MSVVSKRVLWAVIGLLAVAVIVTVVVALVRPKPDPFRAGAGGAVPTGAAASASGSGGVTPAAVGSGAARGTRAMNQVPNPKAVMVEFIDFECEGCAAIMPTVKELKQVYGDRVSFEIRYFPLPGHANSVIAARAVESAARQGKFFEMADLMIANQVQWGEQKTSQEEVFRGYARDLGLDMTRWEADFASSEVLEVIKRDVALGQSLGVMGTPTFFVNGDRIELNTTADLANALEKAVS